MTDALLEMCQEQEAIERFERGEKPMFSTGVCEFLTCGYGEMSASGYWEFPLYPAEKYMGMK